MTAPDARDSAGAKEEYVSLRNEHLYRMQGIHRVIGLIVTGFFASAIFLLWGRGASDTADSVRLFWTSPLLLGMVTIAAFVLLRWIRGMHRAGAYLVVFHEEAGPDNVPKNLRGLGWHTRTLRRDAPRSLIDRLSPAEGAVTPLALLTVAACGPIVLGLARELCNPWQPANKWALGLCMAEMIVTVVLLCQLACIGGAQREFRRQWEAMRDNETRDRQK